MVIPTKWLSPKLHRQHDGDAISKKIIKKIIKKSTSQKLTSKTKECPSCAMDVDAASEICPICSYEFPTVSMSLKVGAWLMLILMIIWLLF